MPLKGEKWTQDKTWSRKPQELGLNVVISEAKPGLSDKPGVIHQGNNSGFQAINLAYMMGATRILLLGYNMKGKGEHFFGKHALPGLSSETDYTKYINAFNEINTPGLEIINCTENSALTCFPKMSLDDAINV